MENKKNEKVLDQMTGSEKSLDSSKNVFTAMKTLSSVLVGLLLVLACIMIF